MTSLGDGCIRGCLTHYAACPSFGVDGSNECEGCAPAPRADGVVPADGVVLICDRCYRRLRFLLHSAGDILGRMRSLAQQGKAVVYSAARGSSGHVAAPDQVDAELLEAEHAVSTKLRYWSAWIGAGRKVLDEAMRDEQIATLLCADILDQHHGTIESATAWTLADVHARWGTERRDRFVYPAEEEPGVVIVTPVREWYDPLLDAKDAAKRAGISERQLRTWVKDEVIVPVAKLREAPTPGVYGQGRRSGGGRIVSWFRASEIDAVAERMQTRKTASQFQSPRKEEAVPR